MLQIIIPDREFYDEKSNEFITIKGQTLDLEHSLLSISKWESKWKKPFLGKSERTMDESIDYVRCMTLNRNIDPIIYNGLTKDNFDKISIYIEDSMTATWFNDKQTNQQGKQQQTITSEIIYYWMIAYNIPFECQKWHLNRLLALIRVCEIKNTPDRRMSKKDLYSRNRSLNEARKRHMRTRG